MSYSIKKISLAFLTLPFLYLSFFTIENLVNLNKLFDVSFIDKPFFHVFLVIFMAIYFIFLLFSFFLSIYGFSHLEYEEKEILSDFGVAFLVAIFFFVISYSTNYYQMNKEIQMTEYNGLLQAINKNNSMKNFYKSLDNKETITYSMLLKINEGYDKNDELKSIKKDLLNIAKK